MDKAGAYSNWAVDEKSNYGNDTEQFGQLLATLLGNCHGSSECIKVNKCQCASERDNERDSNGHESIPGLISQTDLHRIKSL